MSEKLVSHINTTQEKQHAPESITYEPGWKKRAATILYTKDGSTIVFDELGNTTPWNPEVREGQTLPVRSPQFTKKHIDITGTDQLVALKDAHMMKRIRDLIEEKYGLGIGADIHTLTPREALELTKTILAERTEYNRDYNKLGIAAKSAKAALLEKNQRVSLDAFYRAAFAQRKSNDRRDVESLLKDADDKDVVCRNQAEACVVIFEALKQLQNQEKSMLNTSLAQVIVTTTPSTCIGTLSENTKVYMSPGEGYMYAIQTDGSFDEQQTELGQHTTPKGEVWKLSEAEKTQVKYIIPTQPFQNPTTSVGHALVEFITLDAQNRYHVLPVNTTDEKGSADISGEKYMNEAILAWSKDASWQSLKNSYNRLIDTVKPESYEQRVIQANYPLLILLSAQEEGRPVPLEETSWCDQYIEYIQKKLSGYWSKTDFCDQQMLLNTAILYIETKDWQKAERLLDFCMSPASRKQRESKGKKENLTAFDAKFAHLKRVLNQRTQAAFKDALNTVSKNTKKY